MRFFHHRTTCLLLIILTHSSALGASSSEQVAPVLGAGTTLSFKEAWSRLADENASIRSSEEMVSKAKNERNAARSLYLPSVSIEGSYTRIDDPIVIDLDPIRQTILKLHHLPSSTVPPFVEQVQDEEFGKVTLQGTWTLFTGGKRPAANQAASARLKDAEAQAETTLAETRSALVSRYFGLRLAQRWFGSAASWRTPWRVTPRRPGRSRRPA
jgi:outer membrane protein TolC